MIAKFARYPAYLESWTCENKIHAKIQDMYIAPKFLGYITENNGMGSRVIGYLLENVEGPCATSLNDLPLCRSVLEKFHTTTGCIDGDANCNNFIIKPDRSAALILDFERAEEGNENMAWELETLEQMMKEDEETRQEIRETGCEEQVLREEIEVMAPLSEKDGLTMDKVGMDEWIEERLRERLRQGRMIRNEA